MSDYTEHVYENNKLIFYKISFYALFSNKVYQKSLFNWLWSTQIHLHGDQLFKIVDQDQQCVCVCVCVCVRQSLSSDLYGPERLRWGSPD